MTELLIIHGDNYDAVVAAIAGAYKLGWYAAEHYGAIVLNRTGHRIILHNISNDGAVLTRTSNYSAESVEWFKLARHKPYIYKGIR